MRRQWLAERQPSFPIGAPSAEPAQNEPSAPIEASELPAGSLRGRLIDEVARLAASRQLSVARAPAIPSLFGVRLTDVEGLAQTVFVERVRAEAHYCESTDRLGAWIARDEADLRRPAWAEDLLDAVVALMLSPQFNGIADELPAREISSSHSENQPAKSAGTSAVFDGHAAPSTSPADPARPYARASVLGARDVEHFFHVDYQFDEGTTVDRPPTTRIGIIYQCNQPCTFCRLAEMNTHIPPARIYAALDASRARGARRVILTGGEPTLCKFLPDYVSYAREHGFSTIELQTNATLLDHGDRALRLRQAGLTDAQVSLHGPDADISDRLTAAPGTHRRTLAGIGSLLDAGVRVLLNHLIFRDNCHLLLDFVEMVERRWGQHRERIIIQFHAPLAEFAWAEHARKHIARYTEYAPLLCRAIDRGRALGYDVKDLQDPTGIPALCVLGADSNYLGPILSQRIKPRLHRWETGWMTRVAACERCEIADACMGIPKGYIELHGDEEFRPIRLSELS